MCLGGRYPEFYQSYYVGLLCFEIDFIRNFETRPIIRKPLQEACGIVDQTPITFYVLDLGPAVENEQKAAVAVQVKSDAVVAGMAKTRGLPFDVFGQTSVGAENGLPDSQQNILERMVEGRKVRCNFSGPESFDILATGRGGLEIGKDDLCHFEHGISDTH